MVDRRKILVVEDNELNRRLLCEILNQEYGLLEAENGQAALGILRQHSEEISLILLDIKMPVMDGYTFLSIMKNDSAYASIPVIVTTQSDSEADEVNALAKGAADFVSKPYKPQVILHRVASIINLRETAAMVNLLQYDPLTGIYSKAYFHERVKETLRQNPNQEYDIICSDVENFKLVNDVFGVSVGDRLLCRIAELYTESVKGQGICGRLNADRFACLVKHQQEYTDAMFMDVLEQINAQCDVKNITMKWGIYHVNDAVLSAEQIYDRALLAAQSIKGQYGKFFALYDEKLRDKLLREQTITDCMEAALAEGQFEIYLQPKYRLRDHKLSGAESLVRWNHPDWGFLPPSEFIPLFEKNGFISKLDQYVWDRTCAVLRRWDNRGFPAIPISVNVSRADIYQADLTQILTALMKKYGLSPSRLHLEITESAYTENPLQIIHTVGRLHRLGFTVEMDDFGSGYSSLNMLNELPIDVLKLDMKFIQNETAKKESKGILRFIMELAKSMCLSVVAEGVETEKQLNRLKEMACDYAQGYYFAKPMPVREFEALFQYEADANELLDNPPHLAAGLQVPPTEHMLRQRQELLDESIAGGMMGSYMEEGFPFYFINRRMLDYLGYMDEAEFVVDIGGYKTNCIHPEDRERAGKEVRRQFQSGDEYTIEYRMMRKDGTALWFHEVGRKIIAENGRVAIISVCYDITKEKRLLQQINYLYEKELSYFSEMASKQGSHQGTLNVTKNKLETYYCISDMAIAHVGASYEETIENLASASIDKAYGNVIRGMLNREKVLSDYAIGKTDYQLEFLCRNSKGRLFWGQTSLRTFQNPETEDIIACFYTVDITEQKLQKRLLEGIIKLDYDLIIGIDIVQGTYQIVAHNHVWEAAVPPAGNFQKEIRQLADCHLDEKNRVMLLKNLDFTYMKKQLAHKTAYHFVLEIKDSQGVRRIKRIQLFYVSQELGRVCMTLADITMGILTEQQQIGFEVCNVRRGVTNL